MSGYLILITVTKNHITPQITSNFKLDYSLFRNTVHWSFGNQFLFSCENLSDHSCPQRINFLMIYTVFARGFNPCQHKALGVCIGTSIGIVDAISDTKMAPLAAYKVPIPTLRIFPFVHLIPRLAQSLVFEKYGGFRLSKCISYCYEHKIILAWSCNTECYFLWGLQNCYQ